MRALILLGLSAATLSGCDKDEASRNEAAAERNVTSELAATNDTTAIDAATGEAADMAADVDFMPELDNESDGNRAAPSAARRQAPSAKPAEPRNTAAESRAADAPDADGEADSNTL